MSGAAEVIGEFAANFHVDELSDEGRVEAKAALLDVVGVALGALRDPIATHLRQYVTRAGSGGDVSVIGTGFSTDVELAALANGALAHILDFDDRGHASTHLFGSLVSLAQTTGATGEDFLSAYVAGREVRMRLNDYYDVDRFGDGSGNGSGPGANGWHATGTLGAIGSAAAAARLLHLSVEQTTFAVGIATSLASGLIANFGTMTKPFHAGFAARNGVTAALMAEAGINANPNVFSNVRGFDDAFCGSGHSYNSDEAVSRLGKGFQIEEAGIQIKPYPSCSGTHRYIEAAKVARADLGHRLEGVDSVTCPPRASLTVRYPSRGREGRFSAPFAIATTLIAGMPELANFTDEFLARPDVQSVMRRIDYDDQAGNKLNFRMKDGEVRTYPLGGLTRLTTPAERQKKFVSCAEPIIGRESSERIIDLIDHLASLESISAILRECEGNGASAAWGTDHARVAG